MSLLFCALSFANASRPFIFSFSSYLSLLPALPPHPLPCLPHPHRKDEGNEFYKKGDYRAAIDAYSLAIAEAPEEPSFYGNRAAANMMILAYESAIEDCDKAIALSPGMVKAYFRKGKALATLGK